MSLVYARLTPNEYDSDKLDTIVASKLLNLTVVLKLLLQSCTKPSMYLDRGPTLERLCMFNNKCNLFVLYRKTFSHTHPFNYNFFQGEKYSRRLRISTTGPMASPRIPNTLDVWNSSDRASVIGGIIPTVTNPNPPYVIEVSTLQYFFITQPYWASHPCDKYRDYYPGVPISSQVIARHLTMEHTKISSTAARSPNRVTEVELHYTTSSQWRYNERDGILNHRCSYCLLNRLFRRRSKKPSKLCVTGLCEGIHR